MSTLAEAVAELDLADADAVADLLRSEGIKGKRNEKCGCPIALHLGMRLGCRAHVGLGATSAAGESSALPGAVIRFIKDFDAGTNYVDLDIEDPS